jgi:hypothetical protein
MNCYIFLLFLGFLVVRTKTENFFRSASVVYRTARNSIEHTHFPTNPKYANINYFGDSSCSGNSSYIESVVLDTCLWSGGLTYYKFVCGNLLPFPLSPFYYICLLTFSQ